MAGCEEITGSRTAVRSPAVWRGLGRIAIWRRGRDSNPRSAQTDNGFQDRRIRPLCHLSGRQILPATSLLCKEAVSRFGFSGQVLANHVGSPEHSRSRSGSGSGIG